MIDILRLDHEFVTLDSVLSRCIESSSSFCLETLVICALWTKSGLINAAIIQAAWNPLSCHICLALIFIGISSALCQHDTGAFQSQIGVLVSSSSLWPRHGQI